MEPIDISLPSPEDEEFKSKTAFDAAQPSEDDVKHRHYGPVPELDEYPYHPREW